MWLLQILKETLNASFDYFQDKVKGRFLAFAIQMVVSYLAVALFTLLITVIFVSLWNQGEFSMDLFSVQGSIEWMRMMDPIWLITIVLGVNYLFRRDALSKRMSFPDFYKDKSPQFWLELVIALTIMAIVLLIYYKNEVFLSYNAPPLELLMMDGFGDLKSPLETLLSEWIYYTVNTLPIIALILLEIRDRKRDGAKLKISLWKVMVALVILFYIVNWTFLNFSYIFGELVLNLIYAPFEMIEIPAFFGVISIIFFKTANFIVLAAIVHFSFHLNTERDTSEPITDTNLNEL